MFCGKCGKQLEDGQVCTCQQTEQAAPAEKNTEKDYAVKGLKEGLTLNKIVTLGIAAVTFLFAILFNWYNMKVTMFMEFSDGFGPFAGPTMLGETAPLGEMSGMLVFAKVLVIINIFVFLAYIAWELVDFKKFIPALANVKIDLGKILHVAFYGLMALAVVFGFIGILATDDGFGVSVGVSFGWVITLIFTAVGLVNFFKPSILGNLLGKAKK